MKCLVIPFFLGFKGKWINLVYQFKFIAKTGGILAEEIREVVGFQDGCKFLDPLPSYQICQR